MIRQAEQVMARVMVTGGAGVLGAVVPRLLADGHEVMVLTRRPAAQVPGGACRVVGDLARGDGLDAAVTGAEVVVHLASRPFRPARVDVGGTKILIDAIRRCGGGPHLVYVSIVGVDQILWPYYERKRQAEVLVVASGLPYTIQRATQFHDLVQIVRSGPVSGFGADLGGPQVLDAADLARDVLSALGIRRPVRPVRIPGRVGAGFRAGHHLAAGTPRGGRTWRGYLEDRCSAESGVLRLPYTGLLVPIRRQ